MRQIESKSMTSWKIERDRLVAQTLAFVQGIEKARPITADVGTADTKLAATCPGQPIEAPQPGMVRSEQSAAGHTEIDPGRTAAPPDQTTLIQPKAASVESSKIDLPIPVHAVPDPDSQRITSASVTSATPRTPLKTLTAKTVTATAPQQIPLTAASERDDILQRVASFRARQIQFSRERQIYYETVQAKIRTTLGNDGGGTQL